MKKLFLVIFILLFFICPVFAEGFYIENYDVKIDVDANKSAAITEVIDVFFTSSLHGIYRDIPHQNASITDIQVSENYTKSDNGNNSLRLKIGNPNSYVNGRHQYVIKYKYNYLDNKNEFYHNIIGTDWKVPIHKVKFGITLPKEIGVSDVGLSIGRYGTKGFNGGAYYSVNNHSITGQTERALSPGEGLTVRVKVPAGYFNKTYNPIGIIVISLIVLLTLASYLTWFVYGKDEPVTPVVNFYPPKGLNSLEVELAYKGTASTKGIVALLIELAHRGYIKITDNGHQWTLHKLKDYDSKKVEEKKFFDAIFKYGNNEVTENDLTYSKTFYKDCQDIISDINKRRDLIFYKESISFSKKLWMFVCSAGLLLLTVFAISGYNIFFIFSNFLLLLFPTIALIVLISIFSSGKANACSTIFIIVWASMFGGLPLLGLLSKNPINSQTLPAIILGLAGLIISGICFCQLPKRNPAGQRLLNDILGLKHFIEVAEKSRLKTLVEQNPEYFYNVLPSAYILDVSDKWIDKFESIMQINPEWYSGAAFNAASFNSFANSAVAVSSPSTSNGGVSHSSGGGGGCSGGGGGGGGGGGW